MKNLKSIFFSMVLLIVCVCNLNPFEIRKENRWQTSDDNFSGILTNSHLPLYYPVVDTGQTNCFDDTGMEIDCPAEGETFHGQDAEHIGYQARYSNNGDGTVTDNVTGLMWQLSPDQNQDCIFDGEDRLSYEEASARASWIDPGGYTDWRLPTIKELYSLVDFSGTGSEGFIPFMTTVPDGDNGNDADHKDLLSFPLFPYASQTLYVDNTIGDGGQTMFGVDFSNGRINGYPLSHSSDDQTFYVLYVRGNTHYGRNIFADDGDGTITDYATGLMWAKDDSATELNWTEALAWVEQQNEAYYLGYNDWRLPNIKELQSIVDYTQSPGITGTAAIDPRFYATAIVNEAGEMDYPYYWSSTTYENSDDETHSSHAMIVAFGKSMGVIADGDDDMWGDIHGAGGVRNEPKTGDPEQYVHGLDPMGDAVRIYNFCRLMRDADL